jgi:nucleoside 2-deoxyribosyltransferase
MATSNTKPRVYLAGPDVFLSTPIARGDALKAICQKYDLVGLFPFDNELSGFEPHSFGLAHAIRGANMDLIKSCDAILANMTPFRGPSMDVGTAYEMGVGAALGKVVVGYTLDGGVGYVDKVHTWAGDQKLVRGEDGHLRDAGGMAVEEFNMEAGTNGLIDNLMMSCGIEKLCLSEEEAVEVLADALRKRTVTPATS